MPSGWPCWRFRSHRSRSWPWRGLSNATAHVHGVMAVSACIVVMMVAVIALISRLPRRPPVVAPPTIEPCVAISAPSITKAIVAGRSPLLRQPCGCLLNDEVARYQVKQSRRRELEPSSPSRIIA